MCSKVDAVTICSQKVFQCVCESVCVLLEEVSQVEESSVMLRVGVQCFPVVALSLLWAACQSAEIVHGAGMTGI